ncbi:MAG: hypothetical protein JJT77_06085 [Crocinitomicaceae bacterium]|nr:hypothetical protein [Crocinitomicaceae bacterium]
MRSPLIIFCFLFFGSIISAQTDQNQQLGLIEQELSAMLSDLRAAKNDFVRDSLNQKFKQRMEDVLAEEWSFDHPFTSLTTVGKITSQDKEVRIISWNIERDNGSHDYHAFILKQKGKREGHYLIPLIDNSSQLPPQPMDVLDAENWYGALYYDIRDVQRGKKTYYTLFGYDAHNDRSTIKLLDILYFTGKTPKFGAPMFETENGFAKRVFFEHAAKAVMSLKYDPQRNMIIFDHLSPESPGLHEFREFYVPDMSYDAYIYDNNKWRLKQDIIAVNKPIEKITLKSYDHQKDTLVSIEMKNEWIDPTNRNAPIDGGGHSKALPEENNFQAKQPKLQPKKEEKKGINNPSGVSYTNLPTNKKKRKKR